MMDDGNKGTGDGGNEPRKAAFHALLGKALTDSTFREDLKNTGTRQNAVSDVLQGTGIQYADIEEELEAAVGAIEALAQKFDQGLKIAS